MLSLASALVRVVVKTQFRRLGNYIQSSAHTMSLHRQTRWVWRNKSDALTGVARLSLPAILALAEEIRHQVSTCPSVMTGVGATVIDVWQKHLNCNLLCVAADKCTINPFIKYSWGAVGLFSGHKTSHVTYLSRSGHPPSRPRRCTGTRWPCRCRCRRCGTGCSRSHWCLKQRMGSVTWAWQTPRRQLCVQNLNSLSWQ